MSPVSGKSWNGCTDRRKFKMQTVVLENLSKTFSGGKKAVKDVSLSLEKGEVFGFLGPKGA